MNLRTDISSGFGNMDCTTLTCVIDALGLSACIIDPEAHTILYSAPGIPAFIGCEAEHEIYDPASGKTFTTAGSTVQLTDRKPVLVVTFTDVTELKNERERLRTAVDNIPAAVYWKDTGMRYIGCNSVFEQFTQKSADDIIGKTDFDLLPEPLAARYIADDTLSISTGKPVPEYDASHIHWDGKQRWLRSYKVPVRDSSGNVTMLLGIMTDISDRKRFEANAARRDRQLEQSVQEAKRANEAKSEFLSRMSHEIRTPMNAIIGMTHIAKKSKSSDKIQVCLDKIDTSSRHLLDIINDILDMSKIEADKLELVSEVFEVDHMLSGVFNVVTVRANERSQTIETEISLDVAKKYIGDSLRISQVITNLLTNAVKFSEENSVIRLRLCTEKHDSDGTMLRISVQDYGIGLSEEQQRRLFDPFEQADGSIARKYGGTGLGLAICKRIVELMGGNISVESTQGAGSTFTFTVLLEDVDEKCTSGSSCEDVGSRTYNNDDYDATAEFNTENPLPDVPNLTGRRILLADDIEINREVFAALVEPTHVRVDQAENGLVAVDMFKANPSGYHLIMMDLHMPVMGGYEALTVIRSLEHPNAKAIPVVAMTADAFVEDVEKSRMLGMTDHISKPINESELMEKLTKYIKGRDPVMSSENNTAGSFSAFLPHVDVEDGLSRLLNNKKLYGRLVAKLKDDVNMKKCSDAIAENNITDALMYVHTLKGVAANLSFKMIHEASVALEAELKANGGNVNELLSALQKCYDESMAMLDDLCTALAA